MGGGGGGGAPADELSLDSRLIFGIFLGGECTWACTTVDDRTGDVGSDSEGSTT